MTKPTLSPTPPSPSSAVAVQGVDPFHALAISFTDTPEIRELIKTQIAPGLSDDQLKYVFYVCGQLQLNPILDEIYILLTDEKAPKKNPDGSYVYYKNSQGKNVREYEATGKKKIKLMASGDGIHARADRNGQIDSIEDTRILNAKGEHIGIRYAIYKAGKPRPFVAEAYMDQEYKDDDKWRGNRWRMLDAKAKRYAFELAFPTPGAPMATPGATREELRAELERDPEESGDETFNRHTDDKTGKATVVEGFGSVVDNASASALAADSKPAPTEAPPSAAPPAESKPERAATPPAEIVSIATKVVGTIRDYATKNAIGPSAILKLAVGKAFPADKVVELLEHIERLTENVWPSGPLRELDWYEELLVLINKKWNK